MNWNRVLAFSCSQLPLFFLLPVFFPSTLILHMLCHTTWASRWMCTHANTHPHTYVPTYRQTCIYIHVPTRKLKIQVVLLFKKMIYNIDPIRTDSKIKTCLLFPSGKSLKSSLVYMLPVKIQMKHFLE